MNDPSERLPPVILLPDPSSAWPVPSGWHVRDGLALPGHPWDLADRRLIGHATITSDADAVSAVTALTRGVGLAVHLAIGGDLRFRLLEDLHQLGIVSEPSQPDGNERPGGDELDDDHRSLIGALVDGVTVTDAARQLNMSRRTASRRLREIRAALGVDSTAEAIARWAQRR